MASQVGISYRRAKKEDLPDVLALLDAVDLPRDGVKEQLDGFLLAYDGEGRILGAIGLECHGQFGLLRSAAVVPTLQRSGLGTELTSRLISQATVAGLREIVLLTTTARAFFETRFGFAPADRRDYDTAMSGSVEWSLPRCSSAALMKLEL